MLKKSSKVKEQKIHLVTLMNPKLMYIHQE